jgi:hypothetical protein
MSGYAFANTERGAGFPADDHRARRGMLPAQPFTPDALLTSVNQCITTPKASARHSK